MEYKHIDDCWNRLRECKSISEMEEVSKEFPQKFGGWLIETKEENVVEVINCWFDMNLEEECYEVEDIFIGETE